VTLHAPVFEDNDTFDAATVRQILDSVFGGSAGVVKVGELFVSQRAAGINRSVDVSAGRAAVRGTDAAGQGTYLCWSDAVVNVPIAAAPGTGLSRWSLIVAQVRDATVIGGANNDWVIVEVAGTPASSPTVPTAPASSLVLARVLVGSNVTTIANAVITDVRTFAKVSDNAGELRLCPFPTAPDNCVATDGAAYSRITYAAAFAKVGTIHGAGDGSTTFNVPDYRGLTLVGAGTGTGLTARTLGAKGGTETHVLTIAELPAAGPIGGASATSTVSETAHSHASSTAYDFIDGTLPHSTIFTNSGSDVDHSPAWNLNAMAGTGNASTGISVATSVTVHNLGSGSPHTIMQPFGVINFFFQLA